MRYQVFMEEEEGAEGAGDLANLANLEEVWEFIRNRLPTGVFSDRRLVWVKDREGAGDVSFSLTAESWAEHCETPLAFARCFRMFLAFRNDPTANGRR
ncbi:MAG: hypothetical protein V5B32_10375 [Candidatus Accumulibacter sp. UW26]|jgi:hypothetical protein